jgi:hypothetical protein
MGRGKGRCESNPIFLRMREIIIYLYDIFPVNKNIPFQPKMRIEISQTIEAFQQSGFSTAGRAKDHHDPDALSYKYLPILLQWDKGQRCLLWPHFWLTGCPDTHAGKRLQAMIKEKEKIRQFSWELNFY